MIKAPCYNCTDRHAGCHAECEKYLAWSEERKQATYDRWSRESQATAYAVNKARKVREEGIRKRRGR